MPDLEPKTPQDIIDGVFNYTSDVSVDEFMAALRAKWHPETLEASDADCEGVFKQS